MNEKQRILEMIENGKVTAAEGMDLLNALGNDEESNNSSEEIRSVSNRKKLKNLKIIVQVEEDDVDVNVNVPISLIKVLGNAAKDFNKYIPESAQEKIGDAGVDLSDIDINAIIEAFESGDLENNEIVNISVNDKKDGKVLVKIYVE